MNAATETSNHPRRSRRSLVMMVGVIVVICAGLALIGWGILRVNHKPATVSAPMPEHTFSATSPDTYTAPTTAPTWKPKPVDGDQVLIPALELQAPLIHTGAQDGYLTLPKPPKATWYQRTVPLNSTSGRTLIASHVDSGYGDKAPFSRLHKIEKGTPIQVASGGKTYRFKAVSIHVYNQQALPVSIFKTTGSHQLVLVTCSGPTINAGRAAHYAYNLVVIANPQ